MELLREVRAARQELQAAKRSAEAPNPVTTASVHGTPVVKSLTVYYDSDEEQ